MGTGGTLVAVLSAGKKPSTTSLILTMMQKVQTQALIRSTTRLGRPENRRVWMGKAHFNRSYAFDMSTFKAKNFDLLFSLMD